MYRPVLFIFMIVGTVCAFDLSYTPHGDAKVHVHRIEHLRKARIDLQKYYDEWVHQRHNARKEAGSPVTPHSQIRAPHTRPYPDWLTNQKKPKTVSHSARESQSPDVYASLSSRDGLFHSHKPNGDRSLTQQKVPQHYEDKSASEPCLYSPCPTTHKPNYMQPPWGYASTAKPMYNYQYQPEQATAKPMYNYQYQPEQATAKPMYNYQYQPEQATAKPMYNYQYTPEQATAKPMYNYQYTPEHAYYQPQQNYKPYKIVHQNIKYYHKLDYQDGQPHQSPQHNPYQQAQPTYQYHQTYFYDPYQVQQTYQYQGGYQAYNPYQQVQPQYPYQESEPANNNNGYSTVSYQKPTEIQAPTTHATSPLYEVPVVSTVRPAVGIEKPTSLVPLDTSTSHYPTIPVALSSSVDSVVTPGIQVVEFTISTTTDSPKLLVGSNSSAEVVHGVTEETEGHFTTSTVAPPDEEHLISYTEVLVVHTIIAEAATTPTKVSTTTENTSVINEVTSVSSLSSSSVDVLGLVESSTTATPTTNSEYKLLPTTESPSTEKLDDIKTVKYGYTTSTIEETYPITEVPVHTTTARMENTPMETVSPYLEANEETTTVHNGNVASTTEATDSTTEALVLFTTAEVGERPAEDATKSTGVSENTEVTSTASINSTSTTDEGESSTTVTPTPFGVTYSEYEVLPTTQSLSTEEPGHEKTTAKYGWYTASTVEETYPTTEGPVYTTTMHIGNASKATVSPYLEINEETIVGKGNTDSTTEATDLTTEVHFSFTTAEVGGTTAAPFETDGTTKDYDTAFTVQETVATTEVPLFLTTTENAAAVKTVPAYTVTTASPPEESTILHYTQAAEETSTILVEGVAPCATGSASLRQSAADDSIYTGWTTPSKKTCSKGIVRREDPDAKRQSEQKLVKKYMSDKSNMNMIPNNFVDTARGHSSKPDLEGVEQRFLKMFIDLVVKEFRQGTVTKQDKASLKEVFGKHWYKITGEDFNRIPVTITEEDHAEVFGRALQYLFKETHLARKLHNKATEVGNGVRVKREARKPGFEPWQEVVLRSLLASQPWSTEDERNQVILSAIKEQLQGPKTDYSHTDEVDDTTDNTSEEYDEFDDEEETEDSGEISS